MIQTKAELNWYLACDREALGIRRSRPRLIGDEIWKFQRIMRRLDYCRTRKNLWNRLIAPVYRLRYRNLSFKLGFTIPCDVFGPGLAIVHYGTIVISSQCRAGANCRLHAGVNMGANAGQKAAPQLGDNVYIGPGAKLIGDIRIGNDVCIGANAVVVDDVEPGITVGGIPARKISGKGSQAHIKPLSIH